ncbi:hypothetical protein D3C79_657500 [compost metagenome]
MQQHHGIDDQICGFQRTLRGRVAGQRRVAAVSGHIIAHRPRMVERRELHRIHLGPQPQRGIGGGAYRTRIGIVAFQDGYALRSIHFRQRKHLLEQLNQLTLIDRHGVSPVSLMNDRRTRRW